MCHYSEVVSLTEGEVQALIYTQLAILQVDKEEPIVVPFNDAVVKPVRCVCVCVCGGGGGGGGG